MSSSNYHHGNLKQALIEAGIKTINEVGESNLSLRKVATECGVSNAAPYAHFSSKEELIQAMQDYVTDKFMEYLKRGETQCEDVYSEEGLVCFGRQYIRFFLENPNYFSFLFSQPCMKVNLSLDGDQTGNFPPYEYFKELVIETYKRLGKKMSQDEMEYEIIFLWSAAHGISAIATMKNVTWDKKWEEQIQNLIR